MTSTSKLTPSKSSEFDRPIQNSKFKIQNSKPQLRQWMQQCRQSTLALFDEIDYATFCAQAHPDFSPVGWHLGHIAYTEALWILEHSAGLSPQFPHYRRLFAADSLPKAERVNLPTLAEVQAYLNAVRIQVFDYLETAPVDQQERLWRWLLQHESQHCETIAIVLELQKGEWRGGKVGRWKDGEDWEDGEAMGARKNSIYNPQSIVLNPPPTPHSLLPTPPPNMVQIPAGPFEMGNNSLDALDNERPVHWVHLDTYWIDRTPVTCGQYRQFMQAGGYQDPQWWSTAGWQWLQVNLVTQPRYWLEDGAWDNHPVCGVNWYEAEAYANFVGKRLPTEAEWEKAAGWDPATQQRLTYAWGEALPDRDRANHDHFVGHTTPVGTFPAGQSPYGCGDMLGNVWEWTASWFDGYVGFEHYLYRGYSQAYFDGQHRVLKGGSWATRSWSMRSAFRNWYHPHVREIFAGFRCAKNGGK